MKLNMKQNENKIKCDVETCKHNKSLNCDLDEVNISCICDVCECLKKKETICNNFQTK